MTTDATVQAASSTQTSNENNQVNVTSRPMTPEEEAEKCQVFTFGFFFLESYLLNEFSTSSQKCLEMNRMH